MRKPTEILALELNKLEKIFSILIIIATTGRVNNEAERQAALCAVHNIAALMRKDILTDENGLKARYHKAFNESITPYILLENVLKKTSEVNNSNRDLVYDCACRIAKNLMHLSAVAFFSNFENSGYSDNPKADRETISNMRNLIIRDDIWNLLINPPTIEVENHGARDTSFKVAPEIRDDNHFTTAGNRTITDTDDARLTKSLFIMVAAIDGLTNEADRQAALWAVHSIMPLNSLTNNNSLKAKYHSAFKEANDSYTLLNIMLGNKTKINKHNVDVVYTNACRIAKNLMHLNAVAFSPDFNISSYSNNPEADRETISNMRNLILRRNIWELLTNKPPTIKTQNHGKIDTSFRPAPEILEDTRFTTQENRTTTTTTTTVPATTTTVTASSASSTPAAKSEAAEKTEERPKAHREFYEENKKITSKLKGRYQPTKKDFLTLSNNLLHFASAGFLENSADTFSAREKGFLLRQYKWICENYRVYRKKIGETQFHLYNKTQLKSNLDSILRKDIPKLTSLVDAPNKNGKREEAVKKALKDVLHKYLNVKCTSCYLSLEKGFNIERNLKFIQTHLTQDSFRNMLQEMRDELPANSLENTFYSDETESNHAASDGNNEEKATAAALATEATATTTTAATTATATTTTTTTTATAVSLEETPLGSNYEQEEKKATIIGRLPIEALSSLLEKKPKKSLFSRNTEGKLQTYYKTLAELLTNSGSAEEPAEENAIKTVIDRLAEEFELACSDVTSELEKLPWSEEDASLEMAMRIVSRSIFLKAVIDSNVLKVPGVNEQKLQGMMVPIIIALSLDRANIRTVFTSAEEKEVPNIFSLLSELIRLYPEEVLNCAELQIGDPTSDKARQDLQSIVEALNPMRNAKEGLFEGKEYAARFDKIVTNLNLKSAKALHQKLTEFPKAKDKEHLLFSIYKLMIYFLKEKVKDFEIVLPESTTTLDKLLTSATKYVARPMRTKIKKLPRRIAEHASYIFEDEITKHVKAIKESIETTQENESSDKTIRSSLEALYGDDSQTNPGLIKILFQLVGDNQLDPRFIDDAIRFIQQSAVLKVSHPLGFGYDPQSSVGLPEGFLEGIMFTNDELTTPASDEKIHKYIRANWKLLSPHLATGAAAGKEEETADNDAAWKLLSPHLATGAAAGKEEETADNADKLQKELQELQRNAIWCVKEIKKYIEGVANLGNKPSAEKAIRFRLEALYGDEDDEGLIYEMETLANKLGIEDKTLLNIVRFIQQTAVLEVSYPLGFGYDPESSEESPKGYESFMLPEAENDPSPARNNTLILGLRKDRYSDWALPTKAERAADQLAQEKKAEEEPPEQDPTVIEIEKLLTAFDQIEKTPEEEWKLENLEALKGERSEIERIKGAIEANLNSFNEAELPSELANRVSEVTTYFNELNLKVEVLLEKQINETAAALTSQGSPAIFAISNAFGEYGQGASMEEEEKDKDGEQSARAESPIPN